MNASLEWTKDENEWTKASIVRMINNWSKIIDQYHYCLFALKFLKKIEKERF